MFGEIIGKYIISYEIKTIEHLAIGGTAHELRVGSTDRKIVKDGYGRPFIPGSSLKGVFRSFFDRISHLLNKKYQINTRHKNNDLKDSFICDLNDTLKQTDDILPEEILNEENICDYCLFFGAKGYASAISFTDALITKNEDVPLQVNSHIRIDRGSDTTASGALFSAESVPKDVVFSGKIVFELRNLPNQREERMKKILRILLEQMNDKELYLGGMKSRGYGACNFHIHNIYYYPVEELILGNINNEASKIELDQIYSFAK